MVYYMTMTTGNFEHKPKELLEVPFSVEDINPETLERLKHIPIGLDPVSFGVTSTGGYGFVEFTNDSEVRDALASHPEANDSTDL